MRAATLQVSHRSRRCERIKTLKCGLPTAVSSTSAAPCSTRSTLALISALISLAACALRPAKLLTSVATTATLLACARRLDSGIERENVGLKGYAVDHAVDVCNSPLAVATPSRLVFGFLHVNQFVDTDIRLMPSAVSASSVASTTANPNPSREQIIKLPRPRKLLFCGDCSRLAWDPEAPKLIGCMA